MAEFEKEQVKKALEKAVLPSDIDSLVLAPIAQKYGSEVIIDLIKAFDALMDGRNDYTRRLYIPTLKTITEKAHARIF